MLKATGKHRCISGMFVLVGLVLMLVVPPGFSTNAQVERRSDRKASGFVHEPQLYRTLFHTIFLLNEQAEEAERAGRTDVAQALRRAFKQEAGLEVEQGVVLDRLAAECEQAVRAVDARARAILAARRANYPDGKLRAGQQPLPPSAELFALQREREAVVLRYRDRLQEAFGPRAWEEFDRRVLARVRAGMRTSRALARGGEGQSGTGNPVPQTPTEAVATGVTLISYDPETGLVTGVATVELDYTAQDWYVGRVTCSLRDGDGNPLASQSAEDTDGDGTVSVIVQMVGQEGLTYGACGEYRLRLGIYDPFCGCCGCYLDPWNFQRAQLIGGGWENWYCLVASGYGPFRTMRSDELYLGRGNVITQARTRVIVRNPRLTRNPIKKNQESTHLDVTISVSGSRIRRGDFAVLGITILEGPSSGITFAHPPPPGQEIAIELPERNNTNARFTIGSANTAGDYLLEVRVMDVRRPNGQGGSDSIFDQVTVNDEGVKITLTVTD